MFGIQVTQVDLNLATSETKRPFSMMNCFLILFMHSVNPPSFTTPQSYKRVGFCVVKGLTFVFYGEGPKNHDY